VFISKIELRNVRCFSEAPIVLGENKQSLMITGNNGSGKSAILRSIGMGLCDEISAGSLLRELEGDFIKNDNEQDENATITIELKKYSSNVTYKIVTEIKTRPKLIYEYVEQKIYKKNNNRWIKLKEIHDFEWDRIFITAYGAGLRTEGTEGYFQYFSPDAIYTLFKYSHPLQNPEIAWRRIKEVASNAGGMSARKLRNQIDKEISTLLVSILGLNINDKITLESNGIFVYSEYWGKQALGTLGDGYKGVINLVLDILSWELLHKNNDKILNEEETPKKMAWRPLGETKRLTGIVMIDEIEKHLHPKMQRKIIRQLTEEFPRIQFIISTHSPLCVSGTADTKKSPFKIYSTYRHNNKKKIKENNIPYGLSADEIFIKYFGLTATINTKMEDDLDEYRELYFKRNKDAKQKKRESTLRRKLSKDYPDNFALEESKLLKNDIQNSLNQIIKKYKV